MLLKIKEIGKNLILWVQVWNGQRDAHVLGQSIYFENDAFICMWSLIAYFIGKTILLNICWIQSMFCWKEHWIENRKAWILDRALYWPSDLRQITFSPCISFPSSAKWGWNLAFLTQWLYVAMYLRGCLWKCFENYKVLCMCKILSFS